MPSVVASTLRRRIQSLMGDSDGTYITEQDCFDWINDAQNEICKITECLTADLTPISSVAQTERYTLPNQIVKTLRVTYENRKLERITINQLDQIDPNRDVTGNSGVPTHYYLDGFDIGLWPKPSSSSANAIRIRARTLPTAIIDNDADILEIPDFFREEVVRYALLKAREKDESPEFMAVLLADWHNKLAVSKSIANNPSDSYQTITDYESGLDYFHTDWHTI